MDILALKMPQRSGMNEMSGCERASLGRSVITNLPSRLTNVVITIACCGSAGLTSLIGFAGFCPTFRLTTHAVTVRSAA